MSSSSTVYSLCTIAVYSYEWSDNAVPGIPTAPTNWDGIPAISGDTKRYILSLRDCIDVAKRLPWLTPDAVVTKQHKYHTLKLHELVVSGQFKVAQEVQSLIRFDKKIQRGWSWTGKFLVDDEEKINLIVQKLSKAHRLMDDGKMVAACIQMKRLGEKFLRSNEPWLSIYIFHSCLTATEGLDNDTKKARLQAELHALLAFLEKPKNDRLLTLQEKEKYLETSIGHLAMTRHLSQKHFTWKIGPGLIKVALPTSMNVHGLGHGILEIEGSTQPLYMLATFLEHDLLIGLAEATVGLHETPSPEDYEIACAYAYEALRLAAEVQDPAAISAAILRCGLLQFNCHKYDDALVLFIQMMEYSELRGDYISMGIGLQNIGRCLMMKQLPIRGLEFFAQEKNLADKENIPELQGESEREIGRALLEEGHLWEAEEAFLHSHDIFKETGLTELEEETLVFASITAGLNLWGRIAGSARADTTATTRAIAAWKTTREPLPTVPHPSYTLFQINELYDQDWGGIQTKDNCPLSMSESAFQRQVEEATANGGLDEVLEEIDYQRERIESQSPGRTQVKVKKWKSTKTLKALKSKAQQRLSRLSGKGLLA